MQQVSLSKATDDNGRSSLVLGGFVPFSTSDYPSKLAAVLFCQGCPWRCRYCHNTHLQPRNAGSISFAEVLNFLEQRSGLLDAVVFSGGEPCLQEGIESAVKVVRQMGFKIGLHTAAMLPKVLGKLLPHLDWIGLDIKALPRQYAGITGVAGSGTAPFQALAMVLGAKIDYEVRTTFHNTLIDDDQLLELAFWLAESGVRNYALQIFRTNGCQDGQLSSSPVHLSQETIARIAQRFDHFTLRT